VDARSRAASEGLQMDLERASFALVAVCLGAVAFRSQTPTLQAPAVSPCRGLPFPPSDAVSCGRQSLHARAVTTTCACCKEGTVLEWDQRNDGAARACVVILRLLVFGVSSLLLLCFERRARFATEMTGLCEAGVIFRF
jgi:hypothetical protein